ncbi:HAMP domain-containing protein [Metabacillus sp. KIGAM252]|uniref:histidine kinase n=1 Tax=Metabacillus flavus TaxID=2823519 RepID=A0ABS5LIE6_9BACI|nr:ATP-binding protein [Metabacillus flavus]MBS2970144.1 HAMP domain-containing protein [Metabacillus flavus]
MKIRTLLILANFLSTLLILMFLLISFVRMSIPNESILILTIITFAAGSISALAHFFLTGPLMKAVNQVKSESKKMSEGQFAVRVSEKGPAEIKELGSHFNEMAKKLDHMFQEVKKSEAYKTELIANVSHDLRTPIASILSYVEALQDGVVKSEQERKDYLETIKKESNRLSKLIQELFELSQLDSNQTPFRPETVHADQLVLDVLQQFELIFKEKQVQLEVRMHDDIPAIQIVRDQIMRVLSNLIQNSVAHSPVNSVILLQVKKVDQSLVFSVKDEGQGIKLSDQKRIFERFYRAEKSRNKALGGSGLGLAIAKEFIALHHGQIGVRSEEGKGSEFWFSLPLKQKGE